eukprot:gene9978-20748_t
MKSSLGGYPTQLFIDNKVADNHDLICSICMDVLNDPTQCNAGHLFCRTCILEYLKKSASCPTCREVLTDKSLSVNRFVKNLVSTIPIRCSTSILEANNAIESKCQWNGTLETLEEHLNICEFVEISCVNNECKIKVPRRKMATHSAECQYRWTSCPHCKGRCQSFQLSGHMTHCPKKPVHCSNEGCTETVLSMDMDKHKGGCLWERIDCPLNLIGACSGQCPRTLPRKDLESHLSSSSTICASIQALVGLKRKAETIQDELTASKRENQILKETITKENQLLKETLSKDNKVIQDSLISTNTKLAHVVTIGEINKIKNTITDIEESYDFDKNEIDFQFKLQKVSRHVQINSNIINSGPPNIIQRWLSIIDVAVSEEYDNSSLNVLHEELIDLVYSRGPYFEVRFIAFEIPNFDTNNSDPYFSECYNLSDNVSFRIRLERCMNKKEWKFMIEADNFKGSVSTAHISLFRFHSGKPWQENFGSKVFREKRSWNLLIGTLSIDRLDKEFLRGCDKTLKLLLTLEAYEH